MFTICNILQSICKDTREHVNLLLNTKQNKKYWASEQTYFMLKLIKNLKNHTRFITTQENIANILSFYLH